MFYFSVYFPLTFLPIVLAGLYFLFEDRFSNNLVRWIWWGICFLILVGVGYFVIQEHALYDFFKGYYHGGRKILRNPDVLYDEACYNYVNFPLFAYLFIPLANLPKELAGQIFFTVGYVALLPLAYWLVKAAALKGWRRFFVLGLLLLNGPLDYSIWLGNTTQIVMLFILLALFWLRKGREWLSGIFLAVAGLVKLPIILPSGYFFIRGNWKVVIGGLLVAGSVFALSLIVVPLDLNTMWIERCIFSMAENPIGAYNNQSLSGFLARIYMPGNIGWDPLSPSPSYKLALQITSVLLYIPMIWVLLFGRKLPQSASNQALEFFIILICSLLTSPIAWTHYFVILLIPFAWYISGEFLFQKRWGHMIIFLSIVLISIPKDLSLALFEQTGMSIFLSPQFIGGVFLYVTLLIVWGMGQAPKKEKEAVFN